jgi:hypothetical protein
MESLGGRDGHKPSGAGGAGQPLVVADELVDIADLKRGLQVDRVERPQARRCRMASSGEHRRGEGDKVDAGQHLLGDRLAGLRWFDQTPSCAYNFERRELARHKQRVRARVRVEVLIERLRLCL